LEAFEKHFDVKTALTERSLHRKGGFFKELFVCLSIRGILSEFIEHIFFASELLLFENCTFSNASAGLRGGNNT
jgi:hypothetical protein